MKSKLKYNSEDVKKIIEEHRGGLLVEQLYALLPDDNKPNRKYFIEYLRKIPGVYVVKYDERMNRFFVTTLHGTEFSKRKLLVMLSEWEMKFQRKASWYKSIYNLDEVYLEIIKAYKFYAKKYKANLYPLYLIDAIQFVSSFTGNQKMIFNNRHKMKETISGNMSKIEDPNDQANKIVIDENSIWSNPYKTIDGWDIWEVEELYVAHFLKNNLFSQLRDLINNKIVFKSSLENYHIRFLNEKIKEYLSGKINLEFCKSKNIGIDLIKLYRERVFLEIIIDKSNDISGFLFHVFDMDDNLTIRKITKKTSEITEFITQHNITFPFKINVYCWNEKKALMYKNRFIITSKAITNSNTCVNLKTKEYFEALFKGFNFVSLNLDRFLEVKGRHYWSKTENKYLLK